MEPVDLYSIRFPNGGLPPLTVTRLEGREAMNDLFWLDVVAHAEGVDEAALEPALLGTAAVVSIQVPHAPPRTAAGIIVDVGLVGRTEGGRHNFRLRIAPRAWLLTKRVNTRIFQDKTVLEIASIVLSEHRVPHRTGLIGKYPLRDYCVQYQESDWDFVVRLFAEEAFFFWFEQPVDMADEETLIVADSPRAYGVLPGSPALRFRHDDGGSMILEEDMVTDFQSRVGLETTVLTMRDYDFERPGLDLTHATAAVDGEAPPLGGTRLEHYEHHGEYEETDVNPDNVRVGLDQLRARARTARGRSACRRLAPGLSFALVDHDVVVLDRQYVVTAVEHSGIAPRVAGTAPPYTNLFEVAPAEVPCCLPRPARRVRQTLESAVVVGPAGHEIHCDRYGRVKVQFHWDRDGKRNEHSTCFLRVAQSWSGTDFGHQVVPRIGMEVLVSFLGGDPDRPIVTSCIPNAVNPPQYSLPQNATRSGIRTRSSPGGGGSNEIAFEDRAGAEQLFLHAQRNLDEEVGVDRTLAVGRDTTSTIGADQRTKVGQHRYDETGGDHQISVGGARSVELGGLDRLAVGGARRTRIAASDDLSVGGTAATDIAQNRTVQVGGNDQLRVSGNRLELVDGALTRAVQGAARTTFSSTCSVNAAKGVSLSVGSRNAPASAEGTLSGELVLRGAGTIELSSDRMIRLRVGKTVVTIGPKDVRIETETITLSAKAIEAMGDKGSLSVGKEVILTGEAVRLASKDNAILELDQEAKLDGQAVKIKPGLAAEMAKREEREEQAKEADTAKVSLFDIAGEPINNAPYEVSFFGYFDEGTAADGTVEIPVYPDVEKALVRWGRPKAQRENPQDEEPYEFQMELHLQTKADDPDESLHRMLHNLGHRGRDLAAAIRHYQASLGQTPTGRPDDIRAEIEARHASATPAKLEAK